jgi:hypothetical protein
MPLTALPFRVRCNGIAPFDAPDRIPAAPANCRPALA